MKFLKGLFTLLIFMFSLAVFSFTSEPKQKTKTTINANFPETQNLFIVENVEKLIVHKAREFFKCELITNESYEKEINYISDVGWSFNKDYDYLKLKENHPSEYNARIRDDTK